MIELTDNNKDYLFKVSKFFKEMVIEKELTITKLVLMCGRFTGKLVDEGVIEEEYSEQLKDSLVNTLTIMIDNSDKE